MMRKQTSTAFYALFLNLGLEKLTINSRTIMHELEFHKHILVINSRYYG